MIKKPLSFLFPALLALCLGIVLLFPGHSAAQAVLAPDTFATLAKQISAAVVNIST